MRLGVRSLARLAIAASLALLPLELRAGEGVYKVGDAVDDLRARDLEGKEVRLDSLRGKVVLLNFFDLKCGGCNAEAPHLEKEIWQGFKDRGLVVVGVARSEDAAKKFKGRHGLTYAIWVDKEGKLFDRFVEAYIPWNAVVDREGKVRYSKVGFEAAEIRRICESLTNR